MNLPDLLKSEGVEFRLAGQHHHSTPGWAQVDCPFCSPGSGHYRLGLNLTRGGGNCWVCGPHSLLSSLTEILNKPPGVVKRLLKEVDFKREPEGERVSGTLKLPGDLGPLLKPHLRYLEKRKLDPDSLKSLWGVGGLGPCGRGPDGRNLAWRLFIPVSHRGRVVSWTTRSLSDKSAHKYSGARPEEEVRPAHGVLFGADHCGHSVLVVEGPLDAFRVGPGAVATLGSNFSRAQVLKLSKYPVRCVCFDNESRARARAESLCSQLEVFPGETRLITLKSKDPGSAGEGELRALRRLLK